MEHALLILQSHANSMAEIGESWATGLRKNVEGKDSSGERLTTEKRVGGAVGLYTRAFAGIGFPLLLLILF